MLAEANSCYDAAFEKLKTDAAEAKQGFADAAEKYQLLVADGIKNSHLYFNLANAYLLGHHPVRAIVNYRRCLRIDPTMRAAQTNLSRAEQLLHSDSDPADTLTQNQSISEIAAQLDSWCNYYISPRVILMIMIMAWWTLWIAISLRLFRICVSWRTATTLTMLLFILAATSSFLSWGRTNDRLAIVIQPKSESSMQPSAGDTDVKAGQTVELVRERGDVVLIRTAHGETRWLPWDAVESI